MAENLTLARPYAEAAFSLARAGNALGPWSEALDRMATVAQDAQMQECIGDPKLAAAQLAQLFSEVTGDLTQEQLNFVQVLVDNERVAVLPEIRDIYTALKNGQEGVKDAQIASAFPIDDATLAQLISDLESRYSCKVKAAVTVEPELIGGVRIAIGDQVIDASVRGKLAAMATALKN